MDDNEVSKLLKSYLDKTSLDDPTDELNELRPAIGKLTAAFSASKLAHERQKLVVAAISVLANHLRVNSVQADVLIECQKQLANLNDQRPSELFTPSRKASRQHEQTEFEGLFCYDLLQITGFAAQILHLVGVGCTGCIASQPLLACFHEVLRPLVVDALRDAFTTTQLGNAVFATKAVQDYPDLLFG